MKFDMELLREHEGVSAARSSWDKDHFLDYDEKRSEVMEHKDGAVHVWYWINFENAVEDLNALDWRYAHADDRKTCTDFSAHIPDDGSSKEDIG